MRGKSKVLLGKFVSRGGCIQKLSFLVAVLIPTISVQYIEPLLVSCVLCVCPDVGHRDTLKIYWFYARP